MGRSLTFAEKGIKYAEDVISGKILACEFVKQACERHLTDLKRQDEKEFPYVFNPLLTDSKGREFYPAERICNFVQLFPHVKGKWSRKRETIKLEPWQTFILTVIFGWISEKDGTRRFKTAYVEVARKNAKTTLASVIGLYLLALDDEDGAEIYSAATTADQAKISWAIAKQMVMRSPHFQMKYGVRNYAGAILKEDNASSFKYLSSDSKTLDGLNISGGIIDELHAHKTREVYDVIETGTGSREQPLLFSITTAGKNRTGICYEQRSYVLKLLNKAQKDETYFGIIYTLDKDDDWTNMDLYIKANPNWGVSVNTEDIQRKLSKAMAMSTAQNNFLTKHLNIWVNADTSWMNMAKWDRCEDNSIRMEDFVECPCMMSVDLSSKIDIASISYLFEVEEDKKYALFTKNFLPEETIEESPNAFYEGWAKEGLLIETEGNVIDVDAIEDEILLDCETYNVESVGYDPFQATQMATHLLAEGIPMVEVRATVPNFSEPMKEFEKLTYSNGIVHDGCPVMTWMISNVVCHTDVKDNIYPRKEFPENKIDGVVATIMNLYLYTNREEKKESVYESRGAVKI